MATVTAVPASKIRGGSFLIEERRPEDVFTPEDFTRTAQLLIAQTAEEFASNEIVPKHRKDGAQEFSITRELVRKAGELGLSGVDVPEEYGGMQMDKVTSAIIADRIAIYGGFSTTWGAHTCIGTLPIVYFGTEEQKKKYLPGLAIGANDRRLCAFGIVFRIRCAQLPHPGQALARRPALHIEWRKDVDYQWRICRTYSSVFAKVDGEKFTAFIVERSFPGFSVGAEEHKMGIRGSSTCPLILNDCKVPVENVLGEIGKGHHIAFNVLNVGRFKLGAGCVGASRNCIESAIALRQSSAKRSERSLRTSA